MPTFRKKPVVIEAVQWSPNMAVLECPPWLHILMGAGCKPGEAPAVMGDDGCLHIKTLEGVMVANPGDWIIRGVKGELYPCKPDIFAATYEPVESEADDAEN